MAKLLTRCLGALAAMSPFLILVDALHQCRHIPGDPGWPHASLWKDLNKTVNGRLIKTILPSSVCHTEFQEQFNASECALVKKEWLLPGTHLSHAAQIMNPFFQNRSCDPFTPRDRPCTTGNLASYAVNVTSKDHVLAGLLFAKQHSIRLTIKNTGHDFLGKSTGKGALALWTHNLQNIEVIKEYQGDHVYKGPAVRLGAGVTGGIAVSFLAQQGYRIITGSCPSVGIAGGYLSGGGHGFLSSIYGLAADNVLEWEVVTPQGHFITATPKRHRDVYWALSGGGSGTFGVVLGVTTRIFPDGIVGGGSLAFNASRVGNDTFWHAVQDVLTLLPPFVDGGNTFTFNIQDGVFTTTAITVPDQDATAVERLLHPFLEALQKHGIDYAFTAQTSTTYLDHYSSAVGPLPCGPWPSTVQLSSRLLPKATVSDPYAVAKFTRAWRLVDDDKFYSMGCHAINVQNQSHANNAIIPAWRNAIAICLVVSFWDFTASWDQMLLHKRHLVDNLIPALETATRP